MHRVQDSPSAARRLVLLYGAGETGKSRLVGTVPRSNPTVWGQRVVLVTADPEGSRLGSTLIEDRPLLERVDLDFSSDIFAQLEEIYSGTKRAKWIREEGFTTIITDTLTIAMKAMLTQLADSQRFSEKHIRISDSGHMQPMQGDYLAAGQLLDNLVRVQVSGPFHHVVVCHEQEVRPEEGKPGETIGGPATVGRAAVRQLVNIYNTVIRLHQRPKQRKSLQERLTMERVAATATHGIWQAKFRCPQPANPIPEIMVEPDPVNVWRTIDRALEA